MGDKGNEVGIGTQEIEGSDRRYRKMIFIAWVLPWAGALTVVILMHVESSGAIAELILLSLPVILGAVVSCWVYHIIHRAHRQSLLRLQEALDERGRKIGELSASINSISNSSELLGTSLQRDQILSNVREVLTAIVPCQGAFLFIRDFESGKFRLAGSIGGRTGIINTAMLISTSFDEGFEPVRNVLSTRRRYVVEDISTTEHFVRQDALLDTSTKQSYCLSCIPLIVENEVLGIAAFYCTRDHFTKTPWEDRRLATIIYQSALALGSAVQNELAVHDRLTRLHNHGYFHEELARAMTEARGYLASGPRQGCVSLILLDIDHFKSFNDTYGHQTGDAVLRQLATIIRSHCNPYYETPARYGGEEFAVILKQTPLSIDMGGVEIQGLEEMDLDRVGGAIAKAEALRRRVEDAEFGGASEPLKVTVSLGVGCWRYPQDEQVDKATFVKMVDDQLYRAKRAGRNRVCYGPVG